MLASSSKTAGARTTAIAALLHDAGEDQGGEPRIKEIEKFFGKDVARIVRSCSDSLLKEKEHWPERKKQYIEHLDDPDRPSPSFSSRSRTSYSMPGRSCMTTNRSGSRCGPIHGGPKGTARLLPQPEQHVKPAPPRCAHDARTVQRRSRP